MNLKKGEGQGGEGQSKGQWIGGSRGLKGSKCQRIDKDKVMTLGVSS